MVTASRGLILRTLRITLGVVLLMVGLIGFFIPIFQGWPFGLAGLGLLAKDVPWVRHRCRPLFARARLCRTRLRAARAARRAAREES